MVYRFSEQITLLEQNDSKNIRTRATDMKDVMGRVLTILMVVPPIAFPETPFLLVARELTFPDRAAGQCTGQGDLYRTGRPQQPYGILARALGIRIVGVGDQLMAAIEKDDNIVVDPQSSSVVIDPDNNTAGDADRLISEWMTIQGGERLRHCYHPGRP